ncbi:MAG: hypothetical protein WAY02_12110 [Burkholderiaceae bacterium]
MGNTPVTPTQDAILYILANADEPMLERELGAVLGIDLTTLAIALKRMQKAGRVRCEQRLFGPHRHGQKQGQRLAWAMTERAPVTEP